MAPLCRNNRQPPRLRIYRGLINIGQGWPGDHQRAEHSTHDSLRRRLNMSNLSAGADRTNPSSDVANASHSLAILDFAADIIVRSTLDGVLTYVSPASLSLGYEPRELVGRSAHDLLHPDDLEAFTLNAAQLAAGEVSADTDSHGREFRYRCKDGSWAWLQGNPQLIRDDHGRPLEIVNVFRNVTARRRFAELDAQRSKFDALTRQVAGVGYWSLDVQTRRIVWSDQMFKMFGFQPGAEPPLDLAMAMVHPKDRIDSDGRLAHAIETGEGWKNAETRIVRPDGETIYVDGRAVCETDGAGMVLSVFGTMIDVSDRRRAELAAAEADADRQASVELFENAFKYATIGMALVRLDGSFLKINDAFCDLVGYPEDRMLALDFQAITHPDDLNADLTFLEDLLAGKRSTYQMDKRYRRADGAIVWVNLSVSMVRDSEGRPKHFVSQVQDLTARRKAETGYRMMAENLTDMIATTQLDGAIQFVTPSCRTIAGYEPEDLIGRRSIEFAHPDDIAKLAKAFGKVADGRRVKTVRWRVMHKQTGQWVWVESNPSRFWPDGPTGDWLYLDIVRDVSAQVAQEEALDKALEAARQAAAAKGEFLANMSHEIRTPLTAILGFSSLLAERPNLDAIAHSHLERVSTAGHALLSIVNDVLDFSKLEAGQFEITSRAVAPLVFAQNVLQMFSPQADAKGLQLELIAEDDVPAYLSFDPDRLRQILLNLIGNAIKFTAAGSVRLRVRYDTAQTRLAFAVEDTGPGMRRADQLKLFQRFAQVDASSTRRHGGTGLGLAISKGLTEAMGGEIGVTSKLGHGSTFHFFIAAPETQGVSISQAGAESAIAALGGVRVLVVDDNRMNRELAHAVLDQAGAEVTEAVDGADALRLAAIMPFDIVLLDYRMPGMDGPETLRRLRTEDGPNTAIPVMAFTADADLATLRGGDQFDDAVGKPINPAAMLTTIAKWTDWNCSEPQQETRDAAGN
jgi:PAS domain S-box-containing protein